MKRGRLKIVMIASPLIVAFSLLASGPRAEPAEGACSNKTLRGDYGFHIEGLISLGNQSGTLRGVALTHFDGAGHLSQVDHVVINGTPPPQQWNPGSGPYSVNSDCTGTATINFTDGRPSVKLSLVVVREGAELFTVVDNATPGAGVFGTSTGIKRDEP